MGESVRPVRLQLSRAKGFNLQAASRAANGLDVAKVDRSTKFGNPWPVGCEPDAQQRAVDAFRTLMEQPASLYRHRLLRHLRDNDWRGEGYVLELKLAIQSLRDKNLACWCKPGTPCHADVLLEIANPTPTEAKPG